MRVLRNHFISQESSSALGSFLISLQGAEFADEAEDEQEEEQEEEGSEKKWACEVRVSGEERKEGGQRAPGDSSVKYFPATPTLPCIFESGVGVPV